MILCVKYRSIQSATDIKFDILLDDICLRSHPLDGEQHMFKFDVDETTSRSSLMVFGMSGKMPHHTLLDQQGNIVSDCAVLIESISFDDIDVTDIYCQGAHCYHHDTNGTSSMIIDEFYGFMGHNGLVHIDFELPIYKWFLKHCQ